MTEIPELLPFPDVSTLDFVARCREGIQRLIALDDDERHVLQDNLDNGSVGEPIKHPEPPSRGYILAWNKIVGFIQGKVDRMKAEHEFFQNMGKLGQQVKQAKKAAHEAEGGLKGGFSGGEANSNHNSNQNNKNNECESNFFRAPCIDSHSDSQQREPSRPKSIQEARNYAESQKWTCLPEEVTEWYTMNDNNKWHFYKDDKNGEKWTPITNWKACLKMWLKNGTLKKIDAIITERCNKHGQHAADFGLDPGLDEQEYTLLHQLLPLSRKDEQTSINGRIAEYDKCYSEQDGQQF